MIPANLAQQWTDAAWGLVEVLAHLHGLLTFTGLQALIGLCVALGLGLFVWKLIREALR